MKAYLLEAGQLLDFIPYPKNGITIWLPNTPVDPNITVVALEYWTFNEYLDNSVPASILLKFIGMLVG